jgi:hypothetical protein
VTTNWKIPLRTAKPTYHDLATICVFIALLDFSGEQASKHEHSFKDAKKILLFIVEGGLFWADSVGDFTRMVGAKMDQSKRGSVDEPIGVSALASRVKRNLQVVGAPR